MLCNFCPRKCNIDRTITKGFCSAPEHLIIARAALHKWEEPIICKGAGCGAIFFSGCNLRCDYCQNFEISHGCYGREISDERFVEIVHELINQGCCNIDLVNPSHYAKRLSRIFAHFKPDVPLVYNSSGYDSVESLKLFEGIVDIYLPDFKYISNQRAYDYSKANDYFEICADAIKEMKRQQPNDIYEGDFLKRGVIIRHLVLPKNTNQSIKILDYIKDNFGTDTIISLMGQYIPCGNAAVHPDINRKITRREYNKVVDYAIDCGFNNLIIQELESADASYIPSFDLSGV